MQNIIVPDVALPVHAHAVIGLQHGDASTQMPEEFARAVEGVSGSLQTAEHAEDAFANGTGSLQDAVYERARADIALSVATAATGHIVQDVQSLLNMQV